MSSINQTLFYRLRQTLLKCDEFQNPSVLSALMLDERLASWQINLPGADNLGERVDLVIDYLLKKEYVNGENALVLLLRVLAERRYPQDKLQQELLILAKELDDRQKGIQPMPEPSPHQKTEVEMDQQMRNTLLDVLSRV